LCILNKNFGDYTINPVLRASVSWTLRARYPSAFKPGPTTPSFKPDWRSWSKSLQILQSDFNIVGKIMTKTFKCIGVIAASHELRPKL